MSNNFTDPRDGKVYKTVKIGNQIWMAENLNYETEGSRCYDNDPANARKYGRLYDWETAQKACPEVFIRIYYTVSPKIVELFGNKKWFSKLWKPIINSIVRKLQNGGIA